MPKKSTKIPESKVRAPKQPRRSKKAADSSKVSDSEASVSASISSRGSIPKRVLKQVAEDIEKAGGLKDFDAGVDQALSIILDGGDPECYGHRGDEIRRQLSQKVTQWKSLPHEKYLRILYKLEVTPAALRKKSEITKVVNNKKRREKKKDNTAPGLSTSERFSVAKPHISFAPDPLFARADNILQEIHDYEQDQLVKKFGNLKVLNKKLAKPTKLDKPKLDKPVALALPSIDRSKNMPRNGTSTLPNDVCFIVLYTTICHVLKPVAHCLSHSLYRSNRHQYRGRGRSRSWPPLPQVLELPGW